MKISGFTIARNAIKFNYPIEESIQSILPVCDEFVVNVGDSQDNTLEVVRAINDPKIKIIETVWDMEHGEGVLGDQTNLALKECTGDWAIYLQSDEIIHQKDALKLKKYMARHLHDREVDAFRLQWLHFYGSYWRYRIDAGWFQKQDRIIRNNGEVESFDGAFGFRRKDGQPLKRKNTLCFLYHYGWVHPDNIMTQRRVNAENIGFTNLSKTERTDDYTYGDLKRFPVYFGTHPAVMEERINQHAVSLKDRKVIDKKFWWYPPKVLNIRYKTGRRIKHKIE